MRIFKKTFVFALLLLPICLFSMKQGSWEETDKCGNSVMYEWQKITDYTIFLNVWTTLIPTFAEAFADNEREFLLDPITLQIKKEYVEIVNALPANDRWVPRIAIASADRDARVECWKQKALQSVEEKKVTLLMHPENLPNHTSTFFILIAKSKTSDILGFAVFVISPQDASVGSAFCDVLGVVQNARGRGLARPLVLSILTVMSEIKHIHLKTRIWNTRALAVYKKLGFTEYGLDGCGISLEYVKPTF